MKLRVEGCASSLAGRAVAPPDKSITHRALFVAALAEGTSIVEPLGKGADNKSTISALRALGVKIEVEGDKAIVQGVGSPKNFTAPSAPIDCGNSGTTMRMLSGILAATPHKITLTGDESLCGRPMGRLQPLADMGAKIDGVRKNNALYPPITIEGGALKGREHRLKIASAQVKSALLLAGLWADSPTTVIEPERSRDHTERLLKKLDVKLEERAEDGALTVHPIDKPWPAQQFVIAPDPSSAAFILAAALITNSDNVEVISSINPTRAGFVDVLAAFGAMVMISPQGDRGGEPIAAISVEAPKTGLKGAIIEGTLTLRSIDEVPVIAAVAAFAHGKTVIKDAGELRVKESDRLKATAELVRAFGGDVEETEDGLIISGDPAKIRPADVDGGADHRLAMTAVVLALGARGYSTVAGAEIIDVSFPGFVEMINGLGGRVETFGPAVSGEVR